MPVARLEPFTVSAAVPAEERDTVPREAFPRVKATLPAGAAVPEAGFTVAVKTVVALGAMLAGLAVRVSVVVTGGAATLTVTVPDDAAKLVFPP